MKRKNMQWVGIGVMTLGLSLPFAVQAHQDDEAMAFIVGAAVGYAIGDDGDKHRHARYRSPRYAHPQRHHDRYWRGHTKAHAKAHARAHKRWRRANHARHRDAYAYAPPNRAYRDGGRYHRDGSRDGYRDRGGRYEHDGYRRPHKG